MSLPGYTHTYPRAQANRETELVSKNEKRSSELRFKAVNPIKQKNCKLISCLFLFLFSNHASTAQHTSSRSSNNSSPLSPSSTQSTLLAPPFPSSHCLAYLPSLSQPSVVMLYRASDKVDQTPEGQRSPRPECEEGRKRRREESEEDEMAVKKKGTCGLEENDKVRWCWISLCLLV